MIQYQQYRTLPADYVRSRIEEFLAEDMPEGDVTTLGTMIKKPLPCRAELIAVEAQVFSGEQILPFCFSEGTKLDLKVQDGQEVPAGTVLALITGNPADLLTHERVMLNLLQRLAGIASLTKKYAKIAEPFGVKILDTRKTTPGLRLFEKYAVTCGGGYNHRIDLSSGILIKDNHLQAAGSVEAAVKGCRLLGSELPVELEVDTLEQIGEGLKAGVDGFLLDNMSPEITIQAVCLIRNSPDGENIFIESSGGITLKTLAGYMPTGINAVSVGALTHSAGSRDIRLEFV